MTDDIVDRIAEVTPELDVLRRRRPVTREQLQASFDALFRPASVEHVSQAERELVAAFATGLAGAEDPTAEFYAARAQEGDPQRAAVVVAEAAVAATRGPFGTYTELGLQAENADGPRYVPSEAVVAAVGERVAAALTHTHLLVFRPREASGTDLGRLVDAGWSTDGIVTLSQLVSFLAFQQRVVTGLRVLAAAGLTTTATPEISEEEAA
ncbi:MULTISPECIES: CMD domain protein [unclassified Microbacterium]|uniref:CMD domain protein n=1 Tax=unclassified Microbacterium TaxID=2609290 RepID=UPI001604C9A6|nr:MULTISPECIES: CMD domain protein [unclassified Microbacterium]QNA93143.1 CMD domain protein [Microbacterium sp. Se63.02b]QYM63339.1 CMD domain protein [Microbacterium sp. Se5.02b]